MNETLILLLLLGVFSGFVAGLLGVGGGLIMVPALLYLLAPTINQSALMHTAIGTALAAIVFTSLSSVYAHHKHGAILWQNFFKLTPTVLLGAYSGAVVAKYMSFDFLRIFFSFFEISVALSFSTNYQSICTNAHCNWYRTSGDCFYLAFKRICAPQTPSDTLEKLS